MAPPIGTVYDKDRTGNAKIKSRELDRITILSNSAGANLEFGEEIRFEVANEGTRVYFAHKWSRYQGDSTTPEVTPNTQPALEDQIEMVLLDEVTGHVLIVGNGHVPGRLQHPPTGPICGSRYTLTSCVELNVDGAHHLASSLGISAHKILEGKYPGTEVDCALSYVWQDSSHPDRQSVEQAITDLRRCYFNL